MSEPTPEEITSPVAKTAGEQDHSDPWSFAGEEAPAPTQNSVAPPVADGTGPEGEI